MSSSLPSDAAQLQELTRALAANALAQATGVAFALARRGALPIMQLIGLAGLMAHAGQAARAAELYHLWLRCTESPLLYAAWYNLGVLQIQADEPQEAEQSLRAALTIKPDFLDARMALGTVQERLGQHGAALACWRAVLASIDPEQPASRARQIQALNSMARVAACAGHAAEAEDACARSLLLDPRQPDVAAQWIELRQRQCAWPVCAPLPGLAEAELEHSAPAAAMLCLSDDPAAQLAAAARHPVNRAPTPAPLADGQGYLHPRLRIGYLAADFGGHAAPLAAELYGLHRRAQFAVYGFSWRAQDGGGPRPPGAARLDHHISLAAMSDLQAAQTIRAHEIDILVDLHGLGADGRPGIVAQRAAPVQIAWPGHPGSSAMPAVDYVLADAFVLPPALTAAFTERPLYLPDCGQRHARRHAVGPAPGRAACGLPPDGFVFCSFGSPRKLAPARFALWMRILQRVPGSVLWLAAHDETVRDHLRVAALRHGVASARLVFAPRVPQAEHLARLQLADLCLDTLPCSGGAAAADALWAGVPMLSEAGRSYAGRLGGSMLHAIGLPELVARHARRYEQLAVRLAGQPPQLARLRRRLARNRDRAPLFDTPALVRHLEQLYLQVARGALRHGPAAGEVPAAGLPLVSILVPTGDGDSAAALAGTVRSALAQQYGCCEVIVSDSGGGDTRRRALAALLAAHPRLRYSRAPALEAGDNLDHCLALALGDYVAVAPAGDLLQPDKIGRMMHFYQAYPAIGLVACWRQGVDSGGLPVPGAPLLPVETAVGGASLAGVLLDSAGGAGDALCQPACLLLRRADLGPAFGHYQGKRYRHLAGVATALAMLAGRQCAYLPAPLCSGPPPPPAAADALELALEQLQLLYEPHTRLHFLADATRFKSLLAQRLGALAALVGERHGALAGGDRQHNDAVQQALREGYALLLAPPPP